MTTELVPAADDDSWGDEDLTGEAARIQDQMEWDVRTRGFHVFPADNPMTPFCDGIRTQAHTPTDCNERGKHPACKWAEASTRDAELLARPHYFGGARPHNIGVDCGKSGLVVVDEDQLGEWDRLCADAGVAPPATYTVRTSQGRHVYFRQPEQGEPLGNQKGSLTGVYKVDIRGAGGYVIGAGSRHATGVTYDVIDPSDIAPVPDWLVARIRTRADRSHTNGSNRQAGPDAGRFWWRDDPTIPAGQRHAALVAAAGWCLRAGMTLDEAAPTVRDVLTRCEGGKYTADQAMGKLADVYSRYPPGRRLADRTAETAAAPAAPVAWRLPDDFWATRQALTHIRQAALSRRANPTAALLYTMARVAAFAPHTLRLPPIVRGQVPLCFFVIALGPPGAGKSSTNTLAGELVLAPPWAEDQVPLGSGEGLAELLISTVNEPDPNGGKTPVKKRRQTRHNAYLFVDEGKTMMAMGNRQGATVLETIRTIWTGGTLGQANASDDTTRRIPQFSYTYGLVVGFQDGTVAPLLNDAEAGTPQRFAWTGLTNPDAPDTRPEWPGPLEVAWPPLISGGQHVDVAPAVAAEIDAHDLGVHTERETVEPLAVHDHLLRLKMAALLALLTEGRTDVNEQDWQLAGQLHTATVAVRTRAVETVRRQAAEKDQQTTDRNVRGAVASAEAVERNRKKLGYANDIAAKVTADPGKWSRSELRKAGGKTWRELFPDAISLAVDEALVHERAEPGRGDDKVRLWPGPKRG